MVILRTAWLCGAHYEWAHHVGFALESGLSENEIRALSELTSADWTDEECALLDAVDELHAHHTLTDETWNRLAALPQHRTADRRCRCWSASTRCWQARSTRSACAIDDDVDAPQRTLGWGER